MTSSEVRPGCSGIYPVISPMNGDGVTSQHNLLLLTALMGRKVFLISSLNHFCIYLLINISWLLPLSLTPLTVAPSPQWHLCRYWGLLSCPSKAISSPDWASPSPTASPHGTNGPATIILAAPAELTPVYCCSLYWRPKTGHSYSCDLRNAGFSLPIQFWMMSAILGIFCQGALLARVWLMPNFEPTNTGGQQEPAATPGIFVDWPI